MSTYSFKITKGKYQLSLSTTDRELVVEQFALWVRKASEYAQKHKIQVCKDMVNTQINEEKLITQKKIDEQLRNTPTQTNASINNEQSSYKEKSKELDVIYSDNEEHNIINKPKLTETETNYTQPAKFENILDKSLHAPQTDMAFRPVPSIKKDSAFLNFVGDRKIERKIDYLLLTAYYFTQYEQKPRFTLKQLNAKLMQNLAVIIDHSVLQEAINRDYIECLPDLTGVVGASEYRLTAYGEKTLLEEG